MAKNIYLRELYNLKKDVYIEHLYDMIDMLVDEDAVISSLGRKNQHAFYEHTGLTEEEMYKKIRNKEKDTLACFNNKKELIIFLTDSLQYNAEIIADWFLSDKEKVLALTLDHAPDIVGKGFKYEKKDRTIHEYDTTASTLVLTRSKNPYSEFGFDLYTIYPNIDNKKTINKSKNPSRRDITNQLKMEYMEQYYQKYLTDRKNIQLTEINKVEKENETYYTIDEIEKSGLLSSHSYRKTNNEKIKNKKMEL